MRVLFGCEGVGLGALDTAMTRGALLRIERGGMGLGMFDQIFSFLQLGLFAGIFYGRGGAEFLGGTELGEGAGEVAGEAGFVLGDEFEGGGVAKEGERKEDVVAMMVGCQPQGLSVFIWHSGLTFYLRRSVAR